MTAPANLSTRIRGWKLVNVVTDGRDSKHTIRGFRRDTPNRPMPISFTAERGATTGLRTTVVCAWCDTLLVQGLTGVAYVVCSFCMPLARAEIHERLD